MLTARTYERTFDDAPGGAADEGRARLLPGARVTHAPTSEPMPFDVGMFPPVKTQFGTQFAIFYSSLRFFGYERACAWTDEPNDWNLARRMCEAGVRFHFVPEKLGTYYLTPRTEAARESVASWLGRTV